MKIEITKWSSFFIYDTKNYSKRQIHSKLWFEGLVHNNYKIWELSRTNPEFRSKNTQILFVRQCSSENLNPGQVSGCSGEGAS